MADERKPYPENMKEQPKDSLLGVYAGPPQGAGGLTPPESPDPAKPEQVRRPEDTAPRNRLPDGWMVYAGPARSPGGGFMSAFSFKPPQGEKPKPLGYCHECGAPLHERANFCRECGTKLNWGG